MRSLRARDANERRGRSTRRTTGIGSFMRDNQALLNGQLACVCHGSAGRDAEQSPPIHSGSSHYSLNFGNLVWSKYSNLSFYLRLQLRHHSFFGLFSTQSLTILNTK